MATDFTLITPSYLPDLARAEVLVESVQRCCPGLRHHLIVDHRDLKHFRHLGDRATIVTSEDLLPWWMHRLPGRHSLWLSLRSRPARGWIVQQLRKIAAAAQVPDVAIFCDSDVAFVRPFHPSLSLARPSATEGKESIALLDVEFVNDDIRKWTASAHELLGLEPNAVPPRGHVDSMVCWRKDNVVAMIERIEEVAGTDWRAALMRLPTLSEYTVYGVHTRGILGYEHSAQHPSTLPMIKPSWGLDLSDPQVFDDFFSDLDPVTVGVMIHSKDGFDPDRYRERLLAMWDAAG